MRDLVYIVLTGGFFAIATGFVKLCDRIVGPDAIEPAAAGVDEGQRETVA